MSTAGDRGECYRARRETQERAHTHALGKARMKPKGHDSIDARGVNAQPSLSASHLKRDWRLRRDPFGRSIRCTLAFARPLTLSGSRANLLVRSSHVGSGTAEQL